MIKEAIALVVEGRSLTEAQAASAMEDIMSGEATPAQFGAFVTALRLKGETVEEIAGLARVMRAHALPVRAGLPVVDTCGTGGDGSGTFNISTAAAIVAAGAGATVAKHGNRAMSSACGSADVLEALGVAIDLEPEGVADCLERAGIGFMFAQRYHPSMKFAAAPRREIGIRTVFNILGPLTNPAGAEAQVLGVADPALQERMAEALQRLGVRRALVVHGGGIDELSLHTPNQVFDVGPEGISSYTVRAADLGLEAAPRDALAGGSAEENAAQIRDILGGARGPRRDVVLLNAAAALVAAGRADDLSSGVTAAAEAIDSGAARQRLETWIDVSRKHARRPDA
jgi:anthranilate phosphoribosyltransferase